MAADGHIDSEIARKLGQASQDFRTLARLWNHCNISVRFKFVVFTACIIQRLLYSLEGAWLSVTLRKRLDGFYCKCLRRILKISPSFISRVSNQYVLSQFGSPPLSKILLQRQLLLFGRIARLPSTSVVRNSVFANDRLDVHNMYARRRGRPRNTWSGEVAKIAYQIANARDLSNLVAIESTWKAEVKQYIEQLC